MKRKRLTSVMLILSMLLIPGCWDIKDINDTAFALGIGIDKPADPVGRKYLITFEFAKPIVDHGSQVAQSTFASIEADSVMEAIQRMQSSISRSISLSHLRMVAIGEKIAEEENFLDLVNYLMREQDVALQLRLIFVDDARAQDIFYTKRKFEQRVAAEIVMMGLLQKELPIVRTNNFLDFNIDLKRAKGSALGSRVIIDENNAIVREGAAVFKDWKLHAWLNGDEALAANWIVEDTEAVVVAAQAEGIYTFHVLKQRVKIKPSLKEGKPAFRVELYAEGMVMEEYGLDLDLSEAENLKKMKVLFTETIKQQTLSAIAKSQAEIKADYLGFGKAFDQYYPQVFKTLKWDEVFPSIPIDVEVNCRVKGYGLMK